MDQLRIEVEPGNSLGRTKSDCSDAKPCEADGSLVIPADLAERWEGQFLTSYQDLNEDEKQSDRDQVGRYLPMVLEALDIAEPCPAKDETNHGSQP